MKKSKGFTLIELLIVIAIVAILAAVVLVAVNPARQLALARNAERSAEVNAILSAVNQFEVDYGALPDCVATTTKCIGTSVTCCDLGAIDLLAGVTDNQAIVPGYIAAIPVGPGAACNATDTCYDVAKTATTPPRVTVSAGDAELGVTISYTR